MLALACGTNINFQRGDSRAKFRSICANPVRGGARVDELASVISAPSLIDMTLVFEVGRCGWDFLQDENTCG